MKVFCQHARQIPYLTLMQCVELYRLFYRVRVTCKNLVVGIVLVKIQKKSVTVKGQALFFSQRPFSILTEFDRGHSSKYRVYGSAAPLILTMNILITPTRGNLLLFSFGIDLCMDSS